MASVMDIESEMDLLVTSFGNLVCDVKSISPIVVYRKSNKSTIYCNDCCIDYHETSESNNEIVTYYTQN